MTRTRIGLIAFALVASMTTFGAGRAAADRVVIEPPIFVPEVEFHHEDGYYRTHDGHYYHYDHERNGWHYGRNHEEGVRYEHERERRHH
jgi:hypothetical protein